LASARARRVPLLFIPILFLLALSLVVWSERTAGPAQAAGAPLDRAYVEAPAPVVTPPVTMPAAAQGAIPIPEDNYAAEPVVKIGKISIPRLNLVHDMYQGVTMRNIDHGPSHWPGTALPGQVGRSVIAGHRVTNSRPFYNIDQMKAGDLVIFEVGGVKSTYRMTQSQIVPPDAVWIANQTLTPTAALYACHPKHSKKFRYVVFLEQVPSAP
jgi:sortase A